MRQRGFTMIEVMIACAIVAILAALAYPSYLSSVQKGRRTDAKSALIGAAGQLERYFTERSTYSTATLGSGGIAPSTSLNGYYTLTLTFPTGRLYLLSAVPTGIHAGDPCGTFTYDDQGAKNVSGGTMSATDCW
jgi:type IV pilus assembly protein PilE